MNSDIINLTMLTNQNKDLIHNKVQDVCYFKLYRKKTRTGFKMAMQ